MAAIALATLTPRPDQAADAALTPPWCLVCGDLGLVDVLLNVALFTPFGAALAWSGRSFRRVAALALALSFAVELLQIVLPGRDPSASDLLTNTLGGLLGAAAARHAVTLVRPAPGVAAGFAAAWAALWLGQTALTAAALQPSLPPSWYWGQLAPDLEQFEQFTGRVDDAAIGRYPIRIGRLAASADIRQSLLAGDSIAGSTTPGERTSELAPVVSIFDGEQREIVLLGRWGDDLVYRLRTRAFDLRLRPPAVRLPGAFAGADTLLRVRGRFDPAEGSFAVALSSANSAQQRSVALDAQWGWSLLLPFPYAHGSRSGWLTAIWVAAWMVPLGYWSAAARLAALPVAAVVVIVGLTVIPLAAGLAPAGSGDWVGALTGLLAGTAAWLSRGAPGAPPRRKRA
jgi:hypothetical protein